MQPCQRKTLLIIIIIVCGMMLLWRQSGYYQPDRRLYNVYLDSIIYNEGVWDPEMLEGQSKERGERKMNKIQGVTL